jgi:trehalose/maltose hydrolase-like predicted phosphorylase
MYADISRMDRILKNEGKSPDEYQVLKQADALMTFYVLEIHEIETLLTDAGYKWRNEYLENNLHYYFDRTSHGSTLSFLTHAYLCHLIGEEMTSWDFYQKALKSDYIDIQGGTTGEGIHTGVMAGSVYNTLRAFAGLSVSGDEIHVSPALPGHWRSLTFRIDFRGVGYEFVLTPDESRVRVLNNKKDEILITYNRERITLAGENWTEIS